MQDFQRIEAAHAPQWVAHVSAKERSAFLSRVYLHLAGAVGLFNGVVVP